MIFDKYIKGKSNNPAFPFLLQPEESAPDQAPQRQVSLSLYQTQPLRAKGFARQHPLPLQQQAASFKHQQRSPFWRANAPPFFSKQNRKRNVGLLVSLTLCLLVILGKWEYIILYIICWRSELRGDWTGMLFNKYIQKKGNDPILPEQPAPDQTLAMHPSLYQTQPLHTRPLARQRPLPPQQREAAPKHQQRGPFWKVNAPSFLSGQNGKGSAQLLISLTLCLLVVLGGFAFIIQHVVGRNTPTDVTLFRVGNLQPVTLSVGGGGVASPLQSINIVYPLSERVIAVMVKAGDHVTANQPLLQLDASLLDADISQAANDMAAAQNYLNSVSGTGNAVTIAQAQQAYEMAKNRYNALHTQSSSPLLRGDKLVSPINGVVTQININPGEMFQPSSSLLTVIDTSTVVVHAKLPLSYLDKVHIGQAASVTPSVLPNLHFNGTISTIIPLADSQTDTFEVWVSIPNKNMPTSTALLPGMSAFVRIQSQANALVVPRLAVLDADGDATVYVVQNQVAHLQHVQVIGRSVESIFISGGLSPATQIVLVGLDKLQDNQRVNVTRIE